MLLLSSLKFREGRSVHEWKMFTYPFHTTAASRMFIFKYVKTTKQMVMSLHPRYATFTHFTDTSTSSYYLIMMLLLSLLALLVTGSDAFVNSAVVVAVSWSSVGILLTNIFTRPCGDPIPYSPHFHCLCLTIYLHTVLSALRQHGNLNTLKYIQQLSRSHTLLLTAPSRRRRRRWIL